MLKTNKRIVLASQSPRRKELLSLIFDKFDIMPSTDKENVDYSLEPQKIVQELAHEKAQNVYSRINDKNAVIIGSDTIVYCNNKVMLKPRNINDARDMLHELSNNTHSVFTGVSIISKDKTKTFYCETKVKFYELQEDDIENYILTKEPMDKAGAYGIQGYGSLFIKEIEGNYHSVVGLPIAPLYNELKAFI